MNSKKRGIVLMNLGSPDSTEVKDVRRYLNEFLMDPRVIDKPYLLRALLVKGIIVPFRAPKSAAAYRSIWTEEGSPLIVLSEQLKKAVQGQVEDVPVVIAMRYGNPTPWAAYDELLKMDPSIEEVVLFPLYPHWAMSSYDTAVEYAVKVHKERNYKFDLKVTPPYYNQQEYLNALAESMKPYLAQEYDYVLFSYHGIPERHNINAVEDLNGCTSKKDCAACKADVMPHEKCYRHQCTWTTETVTTMLGIPAGKYGTSFQSRLGRDPWLQPYTAAQFEELPERGFKKVLVVCPAFVSDCLETLEEIAEEGKELFMHAGGESFQMIPCLNTHPTWVNTVLTLVDRTV
ncbi:ferrochelatase [Gynurincola endophyticus]|uniref:ferrochelatase n=1 Tax=Gynurincola endophyticus TaxID=2479004 RepID=UPI000F8D4E67|nr:ferrochelatase [Gynurincola endophyticus]